MVHHNLGVVNDSVSQVQSEAKKLSEEVDRLGNRLKVIESQPQEKLIEQVNSIHREVSANVFCFLITQLKQDLLSQQRDNKSAVCVVFLNGVANVLLQ